VLPQADETRRHPRLTAGAPPRLLPATASWHQELPWIRVGLLVGRTRSKPLIGTAPAAVLGELIGTLS
jgi:hypothetical protein